jgi:predicted alpha/beta hydrolase
MALRTRCIDHDGQRLALRVHPGDGGRPALLLPAMGVPAAYYDGFARRLTGAGFAVTVADLRGTGDSTPPATRASRYGYAGLVGDIGAVLRAMGGETPLLIGHSLGGHAAALHLALGGPGTGLVLVASGTPYRRYYSGRWGIRLRVGTPLIAGISAALGYWPGHRLGFGGRQARGVMRDWAYLIRTGDFAPLSGVAVDGLLAEVKVPVLAVSVAGDTFTPAATLDHFCAKFGAAEVTRHHYTAAESGAPMDHFRWTRAAGPLATRIAGFAAGL